MSITLFALTFIFSFQTLANDYSTQAAQEGIRYEVKVDASKIKRDGKVKRLSSTGKESSLNYFPKYYYVGYTFNGTEVLAHWKTSGFLIKKLGAKGEELRKVELTQASVREVIGDERFIQTMESLKSYNYLKIKELHYFEQSNSSAKVCVSVHWGNKKNKRHKPTVNICGTATLTESNNSGVAQLKFTKWRSNNFFDDGLAGFTDILKKTKPLGITPTTTQKVAEELASITQLSLLTVYSHQKNIEDLVSYIKTGQGNL